jgi:hypothetical protein
MSLTPSGKILVKRRPKVAPKAKLNANLTNDGLFIFFI